MEGIAIQRKSCFSLPEPLQTRFFFRILAPFRLKFGALGASWGVFGEVLGGLGASGGRLGGSWGGLRELRVVLGQRRRSGVFFRWGAPIPASTTWSRSPVNKEGESGVDFGASGVDFGASRIDLGASGVDFGGSGIDFGASRLDFSNFRDYF